MTKFGDIKAGMPRASVVELMGGAPTTTERGERLDASCVEKGATEALNYSYIEHSWFDRFRSHPAPATWFVVCVSSEGAVVSKHMVLERT